MNLVGNQLKTFDLLHICGKDISLLLNETLETLDGAQCLIPTAGKLGAQLIRQGTLVHGFSQLCKSSQNRGKFQLPPQIQSALVEHSTPVITPW